ncbi:MAG: hypothetical protein WCX61_02965 [Candidatus Peribacteraceae bacterium]
MSLAPLDHTANPPALPDSDDSPLVHNGPAIALPTTYRDLHRVLTQLIGDNDYSLYRHRLFRTDPGTLRELERYEMPLLNDLDAVKGEKLDETISAKQKRSIEKVFALLHVPQSSNGQH